MAVATGIARLGEHRHVDLPAERAELLDGGGALEVGADEQRVAALLLEPARQLGGVGGLAGALEAGHEHDGGRLAGVGDLDRLAAEDGDELLVDDLDDLLRRVQRLRQVHADGALADAVEHRADDLEVDVRLEQRDPDLAQDLVDVLLAEPPLAAELLEDPVEPVGQCLEHERPMLPGPRLV